MRGAASLLPAILVLLLASLPQAQGPTPGVPLTLLSRDGRRPVPIMVSGGRELIALDDVASTFQVTVREDAGGLTVAYKGRTIVMSTSQPLASVGGRAVALSAPAVRIGNRWFVATDFLPNALGLIYDSRIDLRRAARLLILGDVRVPRVVARIDSPGPPTRATLEITPSTRVSVTTEPGRLLIRLDADALDPSFPRGGAGLIDDIRLADQPATIAIAMAERAGPARAAQTEAGGVTRIDVEVAAPVSAVETLVSPAAPGEAPPPPPTGSRPLLETVVIDPGHGGDDVGVRGRNGAEEKALTLTVAQRVKALVEMRLGVRVILTREGDRFVGLDERAAIANNNKADLFLSLHLNAAPVAASAGAEVFHLRLDREGESVRRAAEGEAVTLQALGGATRTVDLIRWDLAQARHVDASAVFAGLLEKQLRAHVTMSPRPRREMPLRLLTSVNMPAALVEMAYLTNAGQERQVQSDTYQTGLAQAMYDAILQFRSYLEERDAQDNR